MSNRAQADAVLEECARALAALAAHEGAATDALQGGVCRALLTLLLPRVVSAAPAAAPAAADDVADSGVSAAPASADPTASVTSLPPSAIMHQVGRCLAALAHAGAAARAQLVLEGAVRPLLSLVRGGGGGGMDFDAVMQEPAVLLAAAEALALLASEAEARGQMVLEGLRDGAARPLTVEGKPGFRATTASRRCC